MCLKNSVKLKKGEKIYIEAFGPAVLDLMEIFIRKATELGGVPFYFYNDEHLLKAVIDNASEEQMKAFGETYRQQMASSDVYVALRGYDDIFALSDVNERQMALYMQHYYNPVHRSTRVPRTRWCVMRYPNQPWQRWQKCRWRRLRIFILTPVWWIMPKCVKR